MVISYIERAKPLIFAFFDSIEQSVFTRSEILTILREYRNDWGLAKHTTGTEFIDMLIQSNRLSVAELNFRSGKITRYSKPNASEFELFQSVKPSGYFSHFTAIFLHNLTDQIPKSIYLNWEQSPKPRSSSGLDQERIKFAFSRPARKTTNKVLFNNKSVYLLNGKNTSNLGVTSLNSPDGAIVRATDLERTLIDAAVRPEYSGGVYQVGDAYKRAAKEVSANRLKAHLKKLDYIYPFHQAIGFYMQRAGNYSDFSISLFRDIGLDFDFYLTNQMKEMEYSSNWRLHYPKGF